MTVADLVARWPRAQACLLAPGAAPLDFPALDAITEEIAASLNAMGIGRGDVVAAVLPNGPELACAFFAISRTAAFAPLNPAYSEPEFRFYLSDLKARALVTVPSFCAAAESTCHSLGIPMIALRPCHDGPAGAFRLEGPAGGKPSASGFAESDDIALLLHSSGTTARPKLIPLTHRNLCSSALNIVRSLALTPEDVCLNVMPLFHVHGLIGALLSSAAAGATVYCTTGFNAYAFERTLVDARATWYTAVPSMHQALIGRVAAAHGLRFVRSCSSPLHPRTWQQLEETFHAPVLNAYGMTEASHQIACSPLPPRVRKPGTTGVAAGTDVAVMDAAGALLPPGAEGEVVIRGASVTRGYLVPEDANASAFTNGWFRTGDQGMLDSGGYLTLTGRLKEIINSGGEKISPAEIDAALMEHPDVTGAIAFAAPSRTLGEQVCAAVVLREGAAITEPALKSFTRDRLAKFKVPRRIVVVDRLPRGATGKLQRIGMAERLGLNDSIE